MYKELFEEEWGVALKDNEEQLICCPFHDDKKPSMGINISTGLYHCFACGKKGNIKIDVEKKNKPTKQSKPKPKYKNKEEEKEKFTPLTLSEYCANKKLNRDFLLSFGAYEENGYVCFPYKNADGDLLYIKCRSGNKKFWIKNKNTESLHLYGLWRLDKTSDYVFLVEGESDCHTLWQNEINAAGIPGASTITSQAVIDELNKYILQYKTVYLVVEEDQGGFLLLQKLYEILLAIRFDCIHKLSVCFPSDYKQKDISDIWTSMPSRDVFLSKINMLKATSTKLEIAYMHFIEKNKMFDPAIRKISTNLLPALDANIKNNVFHVWDDKSSEWKKEKRPKEYLNRFVLSKGVNMPTKNNVIADTLFSYVYNQEPPEEPPKEIVYTKNKAINVITLTEDKEKNSKKFFVKNRIAYDIDISKDYSSLIIKIFSEWVDEPEILFELCGYCLYRGNPANKFFILFGEGSDGKSTFQQILINLLGRSNVSSEDMHTIISNIFSVSSLYNKLANISGELDYKRIENTQMIKRLTGEDIISAQFKFGNPFNFINYAKLIFATNKIPATTDTTTGFFRRIIIIPFKHIDKNKVDPTLLDKITDEDMQYLLYRSLKSLNTLIKNGFKFTIEKKRNMVDLYNELSDPILGYIRRNCVITHEGTDYVISGEFLENINKELRKKKIPEINFRYLSSYMLDLGLEKKRVNTFDGSKRTCFVGIKYKNQDDDINENEFEVF